MEDILGIRIDGLACDRNGGYPNSVHWLPISAPEPCLSSRKKQRQAINIAVRDERLVCTADKISSLLAASGEGTALLPLESSYDTQWSV